MSRSKELGFTIFFITKFPEPILNFRGRRSALPSVSPHSSPKHWLPTNSRQRVSKEARNGSQSDTTAYNSTLRHGGREGRWRRELEEQTLKKVTR
uniref:Uncharacterized protein n=1 Tax=Arundo donax TaxID=35708 RepID=A0A0A9CWA1_ARUDO